MKKNVLIIYAPYGSGHKSVANNIADYFLKKDTFNVKVLDVAKYANFIGKASIKGFDFIINHRSNHLFSFIYDIANSDPYARSLYCWIKDFTLHLGSGVEKTLSLYSDWYWFGSDGAWIADDICKLCEPYIIDYFKSLLGIK